jgi:hypothetical protein
VTTESAFAQHQIVQQPIEQPHGIRNCAVRDPAGNLLRIQELR